MQTQRRYKIFLQSYKLQELTGLDRTELEAVVYPLSEIVLALDEATVMNRKELQALEASQKAYDFVLKKEKGGKLPLVFAFGKGAEVFV